ncbi:hypothetical protein AAVH_15393 [Aphelenchoides avenae]|nr:hypothetical protein AAVH_15393 [Aphelenchus avenae]
MPTNSGYKIEPAPKGKQIFLDGELCMYYCKSPCVATPAFGSPTPAYDCVKYNPEGAGMSGWLQVALVVIGVLSSYCGCNAVYWIYLWQKGRPSVKPSGENAWDAIVEKKPTEASKDVAVENGHTTKADGSDAAKDKPKDAGEKLTDVAHV